MGLAVGLIAVTLAVIGGFIYAGMKLSRAVKKPAPESDMAATITPTGLALYGCLTALLVLFVAAATLEPDGPLGSFLRSPEGLVVALMGTVAFFSVVSVTFERLGYPLVRRSKNRK